MFGCVMDDTKVISKISKRCLRYLCYVFVACMLLASTLCLALQSTIVQRKLLDRVLGYLHHKTGFYITCSAIGVYDLYKFCLSDIEIKDTGHYAVCDIQRLHIEPDLVNLCLFRSQAIALIAVQGANIYWNRTEEGLDFSKWYSKIFLSERLWWKSVWGIANIQLCDVDVMSCTDGAWDATPALRCSSLQVKDFTMARHLYIGTVLTCVVEDLKHIAYDVSSFSGDFMVSPFQIRLKNYHLKTLLSHICVDLTIEQQDRAPLWTDMQHLACSANFYNTVIASEDLRHYANLSAIPPNRRYTIGGCIDFSQEFIKWEHLNVAFAESFLKSSGSFARSTASMDVDCHEGLCHLTDVDDTFKRPFYPYVEGLEYVKFSNIKCRTTPKQVQLQGSISTNLGDVDIDGSIKRLAFWQVDPLAYNGKVVVRHLLLNKLVQSIPIISLSGACTVSSHMDEKDTRIACSIKLDQVQSHRQCFQSISVDARFQGGLLEFKVFGKDSNMQLDLAGSYEPKDKRIAAHGDIGSLDLKDWSIADETCKISTQFALDLKDVWSVFPQGGLQCRQCRVHTLGRTFRTNSLLFNTYRQDHGCRALIRSDVGDVEFTGVQSFYVLFRHIYQFINHIGLPQRKVTYLTPCRVKYVMRLRPSVMELFSCSKYVDHIDDLTTLEGDFSFDGLYHWTLSSSPVSHIAVHKFCTMEGAKINLVFHGLNDPCRRSLDLQLLSDNQRWGNHMRSSQLVFQLVVNKDRFDINQHVNFGGDHSPIDLHFSGTIGKDSFQLHVLPSIWRVNNKIWKVEARGPMNITRDRWEIGEISLSDGNALILIGSDLYRTGLHKKSMDIMVRDVVLGDLLQDYHIGGTMYSDHALYWQDGKFVFLGQVKIVHCNFLNHDLGTFNMAMNWNGADDKLLVKGSLVGEAQQVFELDGYYCPRSQDNDLAIDIQCNKLDVHFLNCFTEKIFSQINGRLTGKLQVTGTLSNPNFHGHGRIEQGQLQIDILNTLYRADLIFSFKNNVCTLDKLILKDANQGHALLHGTIGLEPKFPIDLHGSFDQLHVLNIEDHSRMPIYGSLYGTGTLDLEGPVRKLLCHVKGQIERGSCTIMPHDDSVLQHQDFIHMTRKKSPELELPVASGQGLSLDTDLDLVVLPEVHGRVFFGLNKKQDYIEGYGQGPLMIKLSSNQVPHIRGSIALQKGMCAFSAISWRREFTILPDSKITFNGDLDQTMVAIQALHRQMVELPYLDHIGRETVEADVSVDIKGKLDYPSVAYHIGFPKKSDNSVQTFLDQCIARSSVDVFYLKQQIISIFIFKRLYNDRDIANSLTALPKNYLNELLHWKWSNVLFSDVALGFGLNLGFDTWPYLKYDLASTLDFSFEFYKFGLYFQLSALTKSVFGDARANIKLSPRSSLQIYKAKERKNYNGGGLGFLFSFDG